mmetsp:Transcript_31001/g.35399  ORF Transcript_31001/g.35399 Transcript_31001/m.35399 type:complete len:186 (-) Transcript_31001:27-584(-)
MESEIAQSTDHIDEQEVDSDSSDEEVSKDLKLDGDTVYFYGRKLPYYEFSNFYPASFVIDGKEYKTSEHYFQSMKFIDDETAMEKVRNAKSPGQAAKMGRDRSNPLRSDWEEVKDGLMYDALKAKFSQHEDLKAVLLGTGTKLIVEHTKNDHYWGDGGDGGGQNMLGRLLVKLRDELAATSEPTP